MVLRRELELVISADKLVLGEQTYTWTDSSGEVYHFAVDRLVNYLYGTDFPLSKVDTASVYQIATSWTAIDPEHVKKLSDDVWKYPITLLEWANDTKVLVDGCHRVVKLKQLGFPNVAAWIVPRRLWERFVIAGIPGSWQLWHTLNRDPKRYYARKTTIHS